MIYTLIFLLNAIMPQKMTKAKATKTLKAEISAQSTDKVDISGFWEGTISRDEGYGKRVMFDIEVIFTQKGKDITGISIVRATEEKKTYSAKMELAGKLRGSYLKYEETKIVSADKIPDADWCIKKVELILKMTHNVPTLEGMWEGVTGDKKSCIPGRVTLKRKPPRV